MSKRLTNTQIHDRCEVYDELIRHLELSWTDDLGEKEQGEIVTAQLEKLRDRMIQKLSPEGTPNPALSPYQDIDV